MSRRVAGCDLGKASASFVLARVADDGSVVVEDVEYALHDGKVLDRFERWYRDKDVAACAALAATGVYAAELGDPVFVLPEDSCQEAALEIEPGLEESLNLVSIGARGYGVLSRRPSTSSRNGSRPSAIYQYLENDKCSSGTGENIQRIAGRFGLTIEEADELALAADNGIPITARCSVFAKSEMTHFANQGQPRGDLFKGYFASVARNTRALLARNEVEGPVYLIGGPRANSLFQEVVRGTVGPGGTYPAALARRSKRSERPRSPRSKLATGRYGGCPKTRAISSSRRIGASPFSSPPIAGKTR